MSYAVKAGKDGALFEIDSGGGLLSFKTPPDHEDPKDSDTDNVYLVDVTVTSGTGSRRRSSERQYTITVTDRTEKPNKMAAPALTSKSRTRFSRNTLTVEWGEPDNTGLPPIVSYRLQLRLAGEANYTSEINGIEGRSYTFEALHSGTHREVLLPDGVWEVRVRAENEDAPNGKVGGPWSDYSRVVVGVIGAGMEFPGGGLKIGTSGTAAFRAVLWAKPGGTVSVAFKQERIPTDTGRVNFSVRGEDFAESATLYFTPENWNEPQTVTVSGISAGDFLIGPDPSGSGWDMAYAYWHSAEVFDGEVNNFPIFHHHDVSFAEEQETSVATLTGAVFDPDPQDTAVTYAFREPTDPKSPTDNALFDLTDGVLTFKKKPNYEDPKDGNKNNVYRVYLTATSGEGDRALSNIDILSISVTDVIGEAAPLPEKPTVATGGSGELEVTWTAASPGRGPEITAYAVAYHLESGGGWSLEDVGMPDPLAHTLTGLVNDSAYKVYLGVKTADKGVAGWRFSAVPASGTPAEGGSGMGAPIDFAADPGDGAVGLSWQMPEEETEEEQPSGNGLAVKGTNDDGDDDAPAPVTPTGYEVGYTLSGSEWSAGGSEEVADMSASITGLENGKAYTFRVRALADGEPGAWSETLTVTPADPKAVLKTPFADLSMTNGSEHEIDLSGHFGGAGLSYAVSVTTTHKKTGEVKTGPLNSVARNKVTGSLEDGVLTLTAGPKGKHVLVMEITATDADGGTASGSFELTIAPEPATLTQPLEDLSLANGETHEIDLSEHFSGTGLGYAVSVTTTHKRTGKVKTGPLNSVARNKVTGSLEDGVLTLTAGAKGEHVLGMEVTATDAGGGTASGSFELAVGAESDSDSLAGEALQNALAGQARGLLEDASSAIGSRMQDGGAGSDVLSAFAGLLGGQGPGGCGLEDSIEDCVTGGDGKSLAQTHGGFGGAGHGFGGGGGTDRSYSLSDLRGLMKSQGFAISLNRPLPTMGFAQEEAPADDAGMQLTLWGQGAGGGSDGAMFWGMDASMGERWMTGIAFAESGAIAASGLAHGDARVSGFAESEVTAVYPYARGRFASGLELWSLAGWGKGRVDSRWTGFAPGSGPVEIDLAGGLGFSLGMAGAEQVLYEADGLSISAVGDAGWSRLAVSGGTADGVSATVTRTRVAVSGRYAEGGLASSLRIGGRVDGGDGETASGAEVSGEVRHAWGRWEVGAQGRWYTAETTGAGFGERGVRAAVGLRAKADGTGLAFALSPGWGASGAEYGDGLLGSLDGDADAEHTPAAHLDGRISWGIQVPGLIAHREMLRPYAEFSLTDGAAHRVRTGVALEGPVQTNLALEHRKDAAGPAEHGVMLRLDTGF